VIWKITPGLLRRFKHCKKGVNKATYFTFNNCLL